MLVTCELTEADVLRATDIPTTPALMASAHIAQLEACDALADESLIPLCIGLLTPTDREQAFRGLYLRAAAFCKSAIVLRSTVHQQTLTACSRTVIELFIDMELLHRNLIPDGVRRFSSFHEVQKLKAARRMVRFFDARPELNPELRRTWVYELFLHRHEARIVGDLTRFRGSSPSGEAPLPSHWSQLNLLDRSAKLGPEFELFTTEYYDVRNFAAHTGLAGFVGLERDGVEILCFMSFQMIAICLIGMLKILGDELHVSAALIDFAHIIDTIDNLPVYALADAKLRSIGERQRVRIHRMAPQPAPLRKGTTS
jgi:hypothetical protein